MRSIPAIRDNLVVLAIDVVLVTVGVLATVGVPTKLPKMKRMTPAIPISLHYWDFTNPGLIGAVRLMIDVEIVHLEECRNFAYLQQVIGLQI